MEISQSTEGNGVIQIPELSQEEIDFYLKQAEESPRRRSLKILHEPGAEINRTVNFMMPDTYLQPHRHPHEPGKEKVERYKILDGKLAIVFFDNNGAVNKVIILSPESDIYAVNPSEWHTPVVLGDYALCYEEVRGVYDPKLWKEFAPWAPQEKDPTVPEYLESLKKEALGKASKT